MECNRRRPWHWLSNKQPIPPRFSTPKLLKTGIRESTKAIGTGNEDRGTALLWSLAYAHAWAAAGVDVAYEVAKAALVLSSDQSHLSDRRFNIARMMARLEDAIDQALSDRYRGYGPLATWAGSSVPKAISPCSSNTNGDLKSCFGVSRRCAAFASITLTHFRRRRCGTAFSCTPPSLCERMGRSLILGTSQTQSRSERSSGHSVL